MALLDRIELGRRIRAARDLAGIESVKELCQRLQMIGVSVSERRIYEYERGSAKRGPSFETIAGIAVATGVEGGLDFFVPLSAREVVRASAESSRISRDKRA